MGDEEASFTADDLVSLLADAGEVDAGVEVLEALRASDPGSPTAIRLQARLFAVDSVPADQRREALVRLRDGRVDALARRGSLLETCVALRLLNREFPEEPMWAEKLSRLEDLLEPLPNAHGDARRAHADALIAMGKPREAWELLREMVADSPMELELARRADALRGLLFEAVHTRPYREGDPLPPRRNDGPEDPEAVLALAREDVARGDLRSALARVALRPPPPGEAVRWGRFRDALTELVGVLDAGEGSISGTQDDETARIGAAEVVDLKIRAGALKEAREDAKRQLASQPDATEASLLVGRIGALDEVLGDAATVSRAPTAPAPSVASVEVEIVRDPPSVPKVEAPRLESPRLEPGDEDMTVRRSSLPTGPGGPGSIEVKRRKIVRLG